MANQPGYLVDTNILLRISKQEDPNFQHNTSSDCVANETRSTALLHRPY